MKRLYEVLLVKKKEKCKLNEKWADVLFHSNQSYLYLSVLLSASLREQHTWG